MSERGVGIARLCIDFFLKSEAGPLGRKFHEGPGEPP